MDEVYYNELSRVRIERANELLNEAEDLLQKGSYKSANNRAFYAIEKTLKALLASKYVEASTHAGCLKQFNFLFIYKGDGTFTPEDYQKISRCEQIRNASDYDDFYIANKEETRQQVSSAKYFLRKTETYMYK